MRTPTTAAAAAILLVVALAVAPVAVSAASSACVSTVFGYESPQTGFDLATDFAPPQTQTCIALDGAAVRHGFLVTYSGGLTSCCVERGVYTAGDCALTCSSTSTDIFYYDTACYHRCYDIPTDICVDAPLFVGNPAPAASVGIQALDTNLPLNQAPQKTYLLNTGNAYASVYALDLGTSRRRANPPPGSVLYCAGRGTTVLDTQSGAATGCVTNPCLPPLSNGFVYAGASCYFSCFQPSTCAPGYSGVNCDQVVDNCAFTQCLNGGTCTNVIGDGTYTCNCTDGFSGSNCERANVNGCTSGANPCQNDGSCTPLDTNGAYRCSCTAGYTGTNCETANVNGCWANPCQNGGNCTQTDSAGAYYCTCTGGYIGVNCADTFDNCASAPCQNGGACTNGFGVGAYLCTCAHGFSGSNCETATDGCAANPCQNGGNCTQTDSAGAYYCTCTTGYTGVNCADTFDNCASAPCQNGGVCTNGFGVGTYLCTCADGFIGSRCETPTDGCAANPCQNGGNCTQTDSAGSYYCTCTGGYFGYKCNIVDPCITSPCANGGTCHAVPNGDSPYSYCTNCNPGYIGTACEIVDHCYVEAPCQNGGSCFPTSTGFGCQCTAGYGGETCSDVTDGCVSNPCQNNATCSPLDTNGTYRCNCEVGFTGPTCNRTVVNGCSPSPCPFEYTPTFFLADQSVGKCNATDDEGGYTCNCPIDTYGPNCDPFPSGPCTPTSCFHGSICVSILDGAQHHCDGCDYGFTGARCELVNPCAGYACGHGGCQKLRGPTALTPICSCDEGYTGPVCEEVIDNCVEHSDVVQCYNGGTCRSLIGYATYACDCAPGYTGPSCTDWVDNCSPSPCVNGGTCSNREGLGNYVCFCEIGFIGPTCADEMCNPNPCAHGGVCRPETTESFSCNNCDVGWSGPTCNIYDYCADGPCQHGDCTSGADGPQCACSDGYSGATCSDVIDNCAALAANPCQNGGSCVNVIGNGTYTCACAPGYTGDTCADIVDNCASDPCHNGGTCTNIIGDGTYSCSCAQPWAGASCDDYLTCTFYDWGYNLIGGRTNMYGCLDCFNACYTTPGCRLFKAWNTVPSFYINAAVCQGSNYATCSHFDANGQTLLDFYYPGGCTSCHDNCQYSDGGKCKYWRDTNGGVLPVEITCNQVCALYGSSGGVFSASSLLTTSASSNDLACNDCHTLCLNTPACTQYVVPSLVAAGQLGIRDRSSNCGSDCRGYDASWNYRMDGRSETCSDCRAEAFSKGMTYYQTGDLTAPTTVDICGGAVPTCTFYDGAQYAIRSLYLSDCASCAAGCKASSASDCAFYQYTGTNTLGLLRRDWTSCANCLIFDQQVALQSSTVEASCVSCWNKGYNSANGLYYAYQGNPGELSLNGLSGSQCNAPLTANCLWYDNANRFIVGLRAYTCQQCVAKCVGNCVSVRYDTQATPVLAANYVC